MVTTKVLNLDDRRRSADDDGGMDAGALVRTRRGKKRRRAGARTRRDSGRTHGSGGSASPFHLR